MSQREQALQRPPSHSPDCQRPSPQQTLSTSLCERLVSSVLDPAKELSAIQTETRPRSDPTGTTSTTPPRCPPNEIKHSCLKLRGPGLGRPRRVRGLEGGDGAGWARGRKGTAAYHSMTISRHFLPAYRFS